MKILLLDNSSLTPLKGDYCIEPKTGYFAKELLGLENVVTLYGQKVKTQDQVHSFKLIENGLGVVGLDRRRNKLLNYLFLYLRVIPEVLKNDFVYIFYPTSLKYVAVICWILRKKYGLYIRGQQGVNNKLSHFIYTKAMTIFTVTDSFTNYVKNITNKDNVFTIRPMIPFTVNDIIVDRKYNNEPPLKILYLGRVVADKGLSELVRAISLLKDKNNKIELNIVGDGSFIPDIKSMVHEFKIEDCVQLIGNIVDSNEIAEYYLKSDVYILPTYHEGFPRTLYEAMIFGTPIITTFVGGIPGLMKDGYNCKRIEPKSVESIVAGLEFAIRNYNKMIEYAKNGTDIVYNILDPERPSHAEHLNQILENS
jgi:glycosyltransferase involved in cell wall biosynthesis